VMHVADNPHIRSLANPFRFFYDPSTVAVTPTPAVEIYRPLATLSHALTYAVFGPDPRGFRLVNIALHAVNAMLLFFLVQALLPAAVPPRVFPWAALLAALAWAVHPVNTESVTWIVGRSNLLCGFFFLLALLFRARGERDPSSRRWWSAVALAAFALALLAKEHAIVLPLILIACDAAAGRRGAADAPRRTGGRGYATFFKVAALYCVLRLALIGRMTQRGSWGGGLASHVALQVMGLATYLRLLVLPFRLRLDYVFDPPPDGGAAWFVLSLAIVALFLVLIALAWKRRSPYVLGLLWIVIALLPVLNLLPIKAVVNERFLYLPAMGLSFLIAWWLSPAGNGCTPGRVHRGKLAGAAAVVLCLGLLTARRNRAWESAFALWGDTARKEPRSFIAQVNYGKACNDASQSELAIEAATAALQATPTCEEARAAAFHIRAIALMRLGRGGDAERDLRRALELDRSPYLYATLGRVLILEGRNGEAQEMLRRAGTRPAGP
jgi:protein O-mannosyl-transferase